MVSSSDKCAAGEEDWDEEYSPAQPLQHGQHSVQMLAIEETQLLEDFQ